MAIVTCFTLVLDVSRVDSDTTGLLLRCLVNLRVVGELSRALLGENLRDGSSQGGLAMIDVAYAFVLRTMMEGVYETVNTPMVPMFK